MDETSIGDRLARIEKALVVPARLRLLRSAQVADLLGISAREVRRMTESGELAHVPVGKWRHVPVVEIERYIREHTVPALPGHR